MEPTRVWGRMIGLAVLLCWAAVAVGQPFDAADVDRLVAELSRYDYASEPAVLRNIEACLRQGSPEVRGRLVGRLAGLVRSADATGAGKRFACTQLWFAGDERTVELLAGLLIEPTTCEIVCYALAGQASHRVDQLLREALPGTEGACRVQVIGLLGQRADPDSTAVLIEQARSTDAAVASAAIAALGRVGTVEAARYLRNARLKATGTRRAELSQAYLACAQTLVDRGQVETARQIYQELGNNHRDPLMLRAGLVGWMGLCQGRIEPALLTRMSRGPRSLRAALITTAAQLPGEAVTGQLLERLNADPPLDRVLLIEALANRHDPRIGAAFAKLAEDPDPNVRAASLRALAKVGSADSVPILARALGGSQVDREAALTALRRIRGEGVEAAMVQALGSSQGQARILLIGVIADRRIAAGADALLPLATGRTVETETRKAALRGLGVLAEADAVGPILDTYLADPQPELAQETARALIRLAAKDMTGRARRQVLRAWAKATERGRRAFLLDVIAGLGGGEALDVVRSACTDADGEIRGQAIRELAEWPEPEALGPLAELVEQSEGTERILAMRGYVRLVRSHPSAGACEATARVLGRFRAYAERPAEQRLLLSGLGALGCVEALDITADLLDNAAVVEEAALATVQIAERICPAEGSAVSAALRSRVRSSLAKVLAVDADATVKTRAEQVLRRLGAGVEMKAADSR